MSIRGVRQCAVPKLVERRLIRNRIHYVCKERTNVHELLPGLQRLNHMSFHSGPVGRERMDLYKGRSQHALACCSGGQSISIELSLPSYFALRYRKGLKEIGEYQSRE